MFWLIAGFGRTIKKKPRALTESSVDVTASARPVFPAGGHLRASPKQNELQGIVHARYPRATLGQVFTHSI